MNENPHVIRDIRKIRKAISEKFGSDPDRYIDYLISSGKPSASETAPGPKDETKWDFSTADSNA